MQQVIEKSELYKTLESSTLITKNLAIAIQKAESNHKVRKQLVTIKADKNGNDAMVYDRLKLRNLDVVNVFFR